MIFARTAISLLIAAWPMLAEAAPEPKSKAEKALSAACSSDLVAFCPNADPNGSEVEECFQKHLKELSPACSKAVEQHKSAAQGSRNDRK